MELLDKANIFRFHNQLINAYGIGTVDALGWNDIGGQLARFKVLSGIGDLNDRSVLDAGCGYGDLYDYLQAAYPRLRYYGVEQMPVILNEALSRYSHRPGAYFFEGDFSAAELPMVDYVIACGSLNYHNSDNLFVLRTIEKLFNTSRIGFGFNLLKTINPAEGFLEAYDPAYIMAFCRKLTTHVKFIEDYYHADYTIFMYH